MDKFLNRRKETSVTEETAEMTETEECINLSEEEAEVGGKRRKTKISSVWQYFKRNGDKNLAKCLTCNREYKTSGNTLNLKDHLKRMHPHFDSNESSSQSSSATSAHSSFRSVNLYFKRAIEYDDNSVRKADIDDALTQFVVEYNEPYNIVENEAFKRLLNVLDPRYKIPSKTTLKNVLIKEKYAKIKSLLQNFIEDTDSIAITSDCWTSVANEGYLTVTGHFIDVNYILRSAVLDTKNLIEVTNHNNAKSMIRACEILKKPHLPCFAHTLNLVVQDGLKASTNLQEIILKCKTIVRFFISSTTANEKLKLEQRTKTPLKVIQDVPTRWNSTYDMIERILQIREAITSALVACLQAPFPLTAEEINVLVDVEQVLRPFKKATEQISGNFVTQSLIIPIVHGLHKKVHEINVLMNSGAARTLCEHLSNGIINRLFVYETRSTPRGATLLDPRFKKEGFSWPSNAEQASLRLENDMMTFSQKSNEDVTATSSPRTNSPSLFSFLEDRNASKVRNRKVDAILMKRQYLERENFSQDTNPLEFWKLMETDFDPMKRCARKFLSIPATSCESERTFSTTGSIISNDRTRLKDKNVNVLVF